MANITIEIIREKDIEISFRERRRRRYEPYNVQRRYPRRGVMTNSYKIIDIITRSAKLILDSNDIKQLEETVIQGRKCKIVE